MRQLLGVLLGGVGTAVLYVACLGWNTPQDPATCTGPYDALQVAALAGGMVLLVVGAAFLHAEYAAAAAAAIEVTVLFSVDAITIDDPCVQGSWWPLGALLILVGAAVGLGLVGLLSAWVRQRV